MSISIHVPLAGDDGPAQAQLRTAQHISIHVPLAGDDGRPGNGKTDFAIFLSTSPLRGTTGITPKTFYTKIFLSTSPLRGTTGLDFVGCEIDRISIHVPLAGDDPARLQLKTSGRNFYPRPPCGGRPSSISRSPCAAEFLSTSPLRGTTGSPTRPRRKSWKFLSTSPLRGTTANVTENTVYFPAHLSQQDTAYKNTLRFCAVCGRFRGASAQSALKM